MAHQRSVTRIRKNGKTFNVPTALLKAHIARGAVVVGPEVPEPKEAKKVAATKKAKEPKAETIEPTTDVDTEE